MDYIVAIAVIYTPEEDEVILRFIIFEDGTVFEFYGNYGSLRSHILINRNIAYNLINNSKKYTYDDKIKDIRLFNALNIGIIQKYIEMYDQQNDIHNYIYKCFILNLELGTVFIKRMFKTQMIYSNTKSLELFNIYKNILNNNVE